MNINLKMFMLCNTIPLLDECKEAEIRRLSIINFPNKFCSKPTRKNEKLIDLNITDKLYKCCNEFFHLLLRYLEKYNNYNESGTKIKKPKEITEHLDYYIDKNKNEVDAYEFIEMYLEYKEGEKIHCNTITDKFNEWCIDNNKKKISKGDFEDLVEDMIENLKLRSRIVNNSIQKMGWKNLSLKNDINFERNKKYLNNYIKTNKILTTVEYIYVLKLTSDKYYIGRSNSIYKRLLDHINNKGAAWTKKYKFKSILSIEKMINNKHENNKTKELINIYGIQNVRGGCYCTIKSITMDDFNKLEQSSIENKCYNCGTIGHYINKCTNIIL